MFAPLESVCIGSPHQQCCFLSVDGPHRHLHHSEGTSTHGHGPQQRRTDALPEPAHALGSPCLREAISHRLVALRSAEPIRLHLALDHVKRVAGEPERLARQATVKGHLVTGHLLAVDLVARRVRVHEPLKREEPDAVRLRLAQNRDGLAPVQPAEEPPSLPRQLSHAVQRPRVQPPCPVGLRLEPDAHVLDRSRDDAVGHPREGSCRVVLAVAETADPRDEPRRALLELAAGVVEGAELDGDAGTDAEERGEGALVESESAFILPYRERC